MRVVVTGSAGFIGRKVGRVLTERGHDVVGFDQVETDNTDFETVTGDLLEQSSIEHAAKSAEAIVHIGAVGDVYLAAKDPALASSVNVTGSANVGRAALSVGARVIYASTWEVYGEPHYEPVDEDHPCDPDHPYNITKLAGERILLSIGELEEVPVVSLRLGTAFGLGMRPNSVFRIFIDKARRGETLTIQGDGSQGRQFTHVTDIANAFGLALESEVSGMALNVVAPEIVTIKELADTVVNRFPTEVTFGEPRPGDVAPSIVSADRIETVLGWTAKMSFQDGMSELLEDEDGS